LRNFKIGDKVAIVRLSHDPLIHTDNIPAEYFGVPSVVIGSHSPESVGYAHCQNWFYEIAILDMALTINEVALRKLQQTSVYSFAELIKSAQLGVGCMAAKKPTGKHITESERVLGQLIKHVMHARITGKKITRILVHPDDLQYAPKFFAGFPVEAMKK
jgi:hypothetical protein